jgi:hypothetical protein
MSKAHRARHAKSGQGVGPKQERLTTTTPGSGGAGGIEMHTTLHSDTISSFSLPKLQSQCRCDLGHVALQADRRAQPEPTFIAELLAGLPLFVVLMCECNAKVASEQTDRDGKARGAHHQCGWAPLCGCRNYTCTDNVVHMSVSNVGMAAPEGKGCRNPTARVPEIAPDSLLCCGVAAADDSRSLRTQKGQVRPVEGVCKDHVGIPLAI